ncbi:3-hydroxyisobutyryl-CoA hydrolase [Malassezia yamatoensis]|uniref:3-hydroxyisobutyryl-CoA hydrolase n=1 Tax=Malassezia yamatoensis TaxID=253288 RepID=A0AAJ5YPU5_9BASI|nr:3-hydroxyisobutyryl-CoA hydrolase [Malassezia yamatoensis]
MPLRVPFAFRARSEQFITPSLMKSSNTLRHTKERVQVISRHMSASAHSMSAAKPPLDNHMSDMVQLLKNGTSRTILLNRPKALNAVNTQMILDFNRLLEETIVSPNCATVIIRGEGRALCSGGDVMAVVDKANEKDYDERNYATTFFDKELQMNYVLGKYSELSEKKGRTKYLISFMDGITMGGGVGLSANAPFRVVTERTMYAMPEVSIGHFPDAGIAYPFSRLDGNTGMYLGLTGNRLSGADTYLLGLATHYIPSNLLDDVAQRIGALSIDSVNSGQVVNDILDEYTSDPFSSDAVNGAQLLNETVFLGDRRVAIDFCFGLESLEQIISSLKDLKENNTSSYTLKELAKRGIDTVSPEVQRFAQSTLDTLELRSPRSLYVTFRELHRASKMTLTEVLHENIHICTVFSDLSLGRDFYTGVKHALTKDPKTGKRWTGRPAWNPESLEKVDQAKLEKLCFNGPQAAHDAGLQLQIPKLDIPEVSNTREYRKKRDAELRGQGPLHWNPSYNVWALPSEAECAALYEGSHPAAGSYVMEPHELIDAMARHKKHKPTLHLKMIDWLRRRAALQKK